MFRSPPGQTLETGALQNNRKLTYMICILYPMSEMLET